jgi:hypothetical protein
MALQGVRKRPLRGRRIRKPRLAAVLVVLGALVPGVLAVISMMVAIKVTVTWLGPAASRRRKRDESQQEAALEDIVFAGHECSESVRLLHQLPEIRIAVIRCQRRRYGCAIRCGGPRVKRTHWGFHEAIFESARIPSGRISCGSRGGQRPSSPGVARGRSRRTSRTGSHARSASP